MKIDQRSTIDGYRLFVADRNNNRIVVLNPDTGSLLTEIRSGFDKPMDVAFDLEGRIYIADSGNDRIVVLDMNFSFIRSFGYCCVGRGFLNNPEGIFVSSLSTPNSQQSTILVYVSDRDNNLIKVFDVYGLELYEFGGSGQGEGKFNKPEGIIIATDPVTGVESIFVADRNNNRVQRFGMPSIEQTPVSTVESANPAKVEIRNEISYPNPFSPNGDGVNDTAKIRFELSDDATVTVKIYNQIGKLVYAFDRIEPGFNGGRAGVNELVWDGFNNAGRKVNNGVYFYHIRAVTPGGKSAQASGNIAVIK
jgi:gliding motility-associated-like protein